jgi:hypothetical protein
LIVCKLEADGKISKNAITDLKNYNGYIIQGDYNIINTSFPQSSSPHVTFLSSSHQYHDFFIYKSNIPFSTEANFENFLYVVDWSFITGFTYQILFAEAHP